MKRCLPGSIPYRWKRIMITVSPRLIKLCFKDFRCSSGCYVYRWIIKTVNFTSMEAVPARALPRRGHQTLERQNCWNSTRLYFKGWRSGCRCRCYFGGLWLNAIHCMAMLNRIRSTNALAPAGKCVPPGTYGPKQHLIWLWQIWRYAVLPNRTGLAKF